MHDWDKKRIRVYKCGKAPQVGDLVMRKANLTIPEDRYGIVTGEHKLGSGLVLPMILWSGRIKSVRSISRQVELVVRNEND